MPNYFRRDIMKGLALTGSLPIIGAIAKGAAANQDAPPVPSPDQRKQARALLMDYFKGTLPLLLRPAEGVLKHPSVAPSLPGKTYSTSLWDWDTLWTSRGMFQFAALEKDRDLHQRVCLHVQGSLLNFLDHAAQDGRLPIEMNARDADPFGTFKTPPTSRNQAKPVFGQLAQLVADQMNDVDWLAPYFDKLLRFYASWDRGYRSAVGLLVWGDDVAIGDDNDPSTFGRPFYSSANLLLNCLYYEDLRSAARLAGRLKRPADAANLFARAAEIQSEIQQQCWDERDSFFYTVDVQCTDRRAELIPNIPRGMDMTWKSLPLKVQMFTGFLPMWCGLATPEQARRMVEANYRRDRRFRANWGVRSLSSYERMYSLEFSSNPSNWLGPVWIIVNYFVWKGLKSYGFEVEAAELADNTLQLLARDLAKNNSLNEYYHPDTGAALSHKGFLDWNLLVLEMY
jgi:putative isomerase